MVAEAQLLAWNRRGLIPGPREDEKAFLHRVELSLQQRRTEEDSPSVEAAQRAVQELYDIYPDWVPIHYDDQGLGLWHGGATVIEAVEDTHLPTIQLRKKLARKGYYLGIYGLKEFLAHEMVHVGRVAFEEHGFEETLAYRTSPSALRRTIGPIFRTGKEAWLFSMALLISLGLDYFFFAMGWIETGLWSLLLYSVPLAMLGYGSWRLIRAHRLLRRCTERLVKLVSNPAKARFIAYRLTDTEVRKFASYTPDRIAEYARTETSLRWRILQVAYFK
jgi:hypothetical protein